MRTLPALLLALGIACTAAIPDAFISSAWAQRMRDYSMTPEESMRQPSTRKNSGNYQQFQNQNNSQNAPRFNFNYSRSGGNYNTRLPNQPASRFMEGFCDPNFQPMLSNSGRIANLSACMEEQKKQACDLFGQMPQDVQRPMDEIMACLYTASNEGQMDENGYIQQQQNGIDCREGDAIRLELLKQYWSDQNLAYAILFLPDMVLGGAARCTGGYR